MLIVKLEPLPSDGDGQVEHLGLLSEVKATTDVSHIFHSSGTSGNPKPIPHTHQGSTTSLPRRALPSYISRTTTTQPSSEAAAFTTTPLFHGGLSDLLRAWMARSMIYFYPTSDVPATTQNIVDAIGACQCVTEPLDGCPSSKTHTAERRGRLRLDSFLSVPYILTVMCEEADGSGLDLLKSMSLVSTGGAPLDKETGDRLVRNGVRLVSRLGSSECGCELKHHYRALVDRIAVLLSSNRNFDTEDDWDWLRNDSTYADALVFEPAAGSTDGVCELVVSPKWRSKVCQSSDQGSRRKDQNQPGGWQLRNSGSVSSTSLQNGCLAVCWSE